MEYGKGKGLGSEGRHLMVPELSRGGPFSRCRNGAGRFEMRGPMGLGGSTFTPTGSPSAECSKTTFSRNKKGGHPRTAHRGRFAIHETTVLPREMLFRRGAQNHRFPFVFLGEFNDFSDPGRPPPFPLETLSFSLLLWILILRGLVRRVGFGVW